MNFDQIEVNGQLAAGLSRRREVRVEPPAGLVMQLAGIAGDHSLQDLSASGLRIHTSARLVPQSIHHVTLTFKRVVVKRRARTVYCYRVTGGGFVAGMEILNDPVRERSTMDDLINLVLSTSIGFF